MKLLISYENPRLCMGAELLLRAMEESGVCGEPVLETCDRVPEWDEVLICVRGKSQALSLMEADERVLYHDQLPEGEGFQLETVAGGGIAVIGGSDTGALRGCVELAKRIRKERRLPQELLYFDAPVMQLRGVCVGLQKTTVEPPRRTYEYPITPERFPWFYDREQWLRLLDMLLENGANVLYLWSGHPFSSLQRLEKYPEALEVTPEEYEKNHETFLWLAKECDRRGIWLVVKFYNIHIPLPFAEAHGLSLVQDSIDPLVQDYSFEAIRHFVSEFPNVGLMVCLGEALRGVENKARWFAETVVPAVQAGARDAGLEQEPPIILRGHDCDPVLALGMVKGGYQNLYTMWKYNGEGLTTRLPRGAWQKNHQKMNQLGKGHIINVHILADLEPYRYFSPIYIMQCVQASRARLGGSGLHLYPLFYWDWPYAPDRTQPRLYQIDRDRLWFEAWLRYAWQPERAEDAEREYWVSHVEALLHVDRAEARKLARAFELAGLCETKLLARVGITEGNRQTLSLGMTMSQLTNAQRYRPNHELYKSVARAGETLEAYAQKEVKGEAHTGETPKDLLRLLDALCSEMEGLLHSLRKGMGEEADRWLTDLEAIWYFTLSMRFKIAAALEILMYKYTSDARCKGDLTYLERAREQMDVSLSWYRRLTELTNCTYLYANSMQTRQRKIPFPDGAAYGHWSACLAEYEKEYHCFCEKLSMLKEGWLPELPDAGGVPRLPEAEFELLSGGETYAFVPGESAFTDRQAPIELCASEINGLKGIRFSMSQALRDGVKLRIRLKKSAYVLIGYFNEKGVEWLQPPTLETDTHADDRGGYAPRYTNAIKLKGFKAANVHAFLYEEGEHELSFPSGSFLLPGVVDASATLIPRDAGLFAESIKDMDWLYEA